MAEARPSKAARRTSPLGLPSHMPGALVPSTPPALLGLRGLQNLGQSCFMNCVLQVLLHCPPVLRFFLSDGHNRFECMARTRASPVCGGGGGSDVTTTTAARRPCIACELDQLFTQCFSGKEAPFSPHGFMHAMWSSAEYFAGYEQQDAHEFLIAALSSLYVALGSLRPSAPRELQRVFAGVLRSDVTCLHCRSRSTKYEDFHDISLDLKAVDEQPPGAAPPTLHSCLRSFTRAERLTFSERCWCTKCRALQDSAKQLSIHRLPNVLCFHLKRFKHSANSKVPSTKIDTFVDFPLHSLNMRPHTSAHVSHSLASLAPEAAGANGPAAPAPPPSPLPPPPPAGANGNPLAAEPSPEQLYDLFGVAVHHGTMDKGHYTSYVRSGAEWFHCDDALVSLATAEEVRSSTGYLLFYVQKKCS